MWTRILILLTIVNCALSLGADDTGCFEKWLQGYRLAFGRPQETYTTGSLQKCQAICERELGCSALAWGTSGAGNGTCELALRSSRGSRSVNDTTNALGFDEIKKASQYDIYVMSSACVPRQPLFASQQAGPVGNGVPIDCFYRLMSGKRVAKNHVFKSISVKELQECQEACIEDRNCRSLNYRYMMTGYTYNVANCELSQLYILNYEGSSRRAGNEFIDDYDYDYFQREPHCKTTSPLGYSGVCAMVVNRGSKLSPSLIKSSHQTSTTAQCEFLCQTASRFRCRAFSVRHTTRGHEHPFHRDGTSESTCILYDADISRLPHYEIVPDPDFDLFEIGRLMGTECVLQDQFLSRRPAQDSFKHTHYEPIRPTGIDYDRNRDRDRVPVDSGRYPYPPVQTYPPVHTVRPPYDIADRNDYNSRRPTNFYPIEDKTIDSTFPKPGLTHDIASGRYPEHDRGRPSHRPSGAGGGYGTTGTSSTTGTSGDLPYYDSRREACLVKLNQDVYLAPEVTRAQFPSKSLEECRIECIRSLEVLRFSCRALSYRLTSNSGGSCQLSEYYVQDLRTNDFIPARDRYENAVVYHYDEADALCRRTGGSVGYDRDSDRYGGGSNSRYGNDGRYGSGSYGGGSYGGRYGGGSEGRYPSYGGSGGSYGSYGGSGIRGAYGTEGRYGSSGSYQGVNSGYIPGSAVVLPPRVVTTDYQRPLYERERDRYPYGQGSYGGGSYGGGSGGSGYYTDNREYLPGRPDTFGREQSQTVNGEKCLRSCVQDKDAGFYYCLLDSRGTWDFCCRPDHFCGYSRGVSVPWCYVGSGPTSQVWRSCHKRSIGSVLEPPIAYLHEGPPPKIHSLSTDAVAALSKDNALKLLKSDLKDKQQSTSDFEDIDGDVETLSNSAKETLEKAGSSHANATEIYYGKIGDNETNEGLKNLTTTRQIRRVSKKPSFTIVEVHSSSTNTK